MLAVTISYKLTILNNQDLNVSNGLMEEACETQNVT